GHLREAMPERLATAYGLLVDSRVEEELRLPDDTVRPAQPIEHRVESDDLLDRVRRTRLLAVAEGGVGDEELGRGVERLDLPVERDLGDVVVRKDVPQQIRLGNVLEGVAVVAAPVIGKESVGPGIVIRHARSSPGQRARTSSRDRRCKRVPWATAREWTL